MSYDFPMSSGSFHTIYKGSASIFSAEGSRAQLAVQSAAGPKPTAGTPTAAGLGPSNQMHNYLCFNGDSSRPQIFANLIKNGVV